MPAARSRRTCTPATARRRCCTASTSRMEEGRITALLGANGAGKTTTLRALCAMVRTAGRDPLRRPAHRRHAPPRTSCAWASPTCPTAAAPSSHLTTEENLRLGAYTRKRPRRGRARPRAHLRLLPAPAASAAASRPARCRAASSRCSRCPRADAAAAAAAARRAVVRPGAADRARALRASCATINADDGVSMLLVEQNAALALDLADHAYLLETGRVVLSGSAGRDQQRRGRAPRPIWATRMRRMDAFLHQVLAGLATGGIYASLALALVMIYQATHHVNFAQGEMAMFSTYIAWSADQRRHAVLGGVPADRRRSPSSSGVVIERIIIRPVENAPVLPVVIVFIGLLVIFNSVAGWIFTYTIKAFPSPFPKEPLFGSRYISPHELGAIGVTLVVLAGAVRVLPLHAARPGDARRGAEPGLEPAGRHPRRLDAGARLGPGGGDRRGGRHDGGADRLPRPEHDGRHPALRLRRGAARRHRQPVGRGARRLHRRRAGEPARRLRHRHRAQADGGAGADRRRADCCKPVGLFGKCTS